MKRIIICFTILLLTLAGNRIYAKKLAGQALIDSLIIELPMAKEDSNRCKLLIKISVAAIDVNPDAGIKYGLEALKLAKKLDTKQRIMWSNINVGVSYAAKQNFAEAMVHYSEALRMAEESKDKKAIGTVYNNIGFVKAEQGDYAKALEYYLIALPICEQFNKSLLSDVLMNIGQLYSNIKNIAKAIEYFEQSLKIAEDAGAKEKMVYVLVNLGAMYSSDTFDYEKAIGYYVRAIKIAKEVDDKFALIGIYGNIGGICLHPKIKNYKTGLACFYSSLQLCKEVGNRYGIALITSNISETYLRIAKEVLSDKPDDISELPVQNLPVVTIPKGKKALLAEAESYATRALDMALEGGFPRLVRSCYETQSEIYELQGNYKKSLAAHKKYMVYNDSLFDKESVAKIAKLETKAEYEKQQLADSIQNAEAQKLADVKLQRQRTMTYSGVGVAVLLLAFSVFIFRNNKKLAIEKNKSETLLYNILPEEVASELKDRGATTAQQFDNVTVLFTDFVNFTTAGERMGSKALVEELHNCFKVFDDIMERHGIEKIKTIGDAYLAVCGLPTPDAMHAEKVIKAAMEIRDFMNSRHQQLGDRTFEIRIGVHSGDLVAGIVGVKKFAYDIWGDTVNTAARMEQNSEAGKINISQTTYELVQDKFTCAYRGELEAKNKGKLKMYFVDNAHDIV